jgi:hypothetical protein
MYPEVLREYEGYRQSEEAYQVCNAFNKLSSYTINSLT